MLETVGHRRSEECILLNMIRKSTVNDTGAFQRPPESPLKVEVRSDPPDRQRALARRERFARNAAWLESRASEVFSLHRGKCICIAGQELFVAETAEEAVKLAAAKHPDDDGYYLRYIYREKVPRIYENRRLVAAM